MAQFADLSSREQDVVNLLLEGKSNKQIASALTISERTVEFHLKNAYEKFHVESRVELVLKLRESTVVGRGQTAENGERSNLRNWATSLREAFSLSGKEPTMTTTIESNARSTGEPVPFFEAIRVCFIKYAEFNGRATRSEFWWFVLFIVLVSAALGYISQTLVSIFSVLTVLPLLAAGSRRLHDTGRSGWWQLFIPVPIAGIIMLAILWAQPTVSPDEVKA